MGVGAQEPPLSGVVVVSYVDRKEVGSTQLAKAAAENNVYWGMYSS